MKHSPRISLPKPNELHLPDGTIRGAIVQYLRDRGYEVDSRSLRIYGYGQERFCEIGEFQGHITLTNLSPETGEPLTQ